MIPGRIAERLRRILSGDAGESRPHDATRRTGAAKTPRSSIPVGHFSLVGLKDVREQLGPRWPEVSERVHALARSVIEKRLLPGDVFEQHDEDSYIVLFAQLGPKEAEFKSLAIGREITRRLIGEDFEAASSMRTACATVSTEASVGSDTEAQLVKALKSARGVISRSSDDDQQAASPHEARAWAAPPPAAVAPEAGRQIALPRAPIGTKIERTAASWLYTPIWDLHHRAVIHFRLTSAEEAGLREAFGTPTPEMVCEIDSWALRKATGDLVELSRQGKRFLIVCPVHAESVNHAVFRRKLLEALNAVPPHLRRLMTIEFVAPPAIGLNAAFDRYVMALKSLGVGIAARIAPGADAPSLFNPAFLFVTVQLDPTDGPEIRQIKRLETFATQAQALPCGAGGLRSTSLVLAATAAGFRYMSGRAVQPEVECISHAVKFDFDRLYGRALAG